MNNDALINFDQQTEWLQAQPVLDLELWLRKALLTNDPSPLIIPDVDATISEVISRHFISSSDDIFRRRLKHTVASLLSTWQPLDSTSYLGALLTLVGVLGVREAQARLFGYAIGSTFRQTAIRDDSRSSTPFADPHATILQVLIGFAEPIQGFEAILERDIWHAHYTAICYTGLCSINPDHGPRLVHILLHTGDKYPELVSSPLVLRFVLTTYCSPEKFYQQLEPIIARLQDVPATIVVLLQALTDCLPTQLLPTGDNTTEHLRFMRTEEPIMEIATLSNSNTSLDVVFQFFTHDSLREAVDTIDIWCKDLLGRDVD